MSPRFSVIIPVYNGERFIRRALQSVFLQEYPAYEIIVVNDGSKDGTQGILDEFKGRIITKTIPNGGVSNARNEGIHMATGDHLAFLDADDSWFRHKLRVTAETIEKYPQAGFVSSDYLERVEYFGNRLKPNSTMISKHCKINYGEPLGFHPLELFLAHSVGIAPSAVVVKKTVAEEAGFFNTQCRLVEDLDFYLRVALRTDFVLMRDILMFKHNHEENMSHNALRMALGRRTVVQNFKNSQQEALKNEVFMHYVRQSLANSSYVAGDLYFKQGQREQAFASYREGLSHLPTLSNRRRYVLKVLIKSIKRFFS